MKAIYEVYQTILMYLGIASLCVIITIPMLSFIAKTLDECKNKWRRLDGLGKVVVLSMLCVFGYVGSTKHIVYYNSPPKVGADSSIQLWFVSAEYDTNTLHTTIQVVWTNGFDAASLSTPLAYRESASNDWSVITYPQDALVYTIGVSNILEFTESSTTNDFSKFTYWWFGIDRPATEIIVTSDDLQIVDFQHTSEYADFYIGMSEELMEIYNAASDSYMTIQFSDNGGENWVSVASTREFIVRIPGFWYGKDRIWRVIYVYQTGEDEEIELEE